MGFDYNPKDCLMCDIIARNTCRKADNEAVCAVCLADLLQNGIEECYLNTNQCYQEHVFIKCESTIGGNKTECGKCGKMRNVVFILPICQFHTGDKDVDEDDYERNEDDDDDV